MSKFFDVGSLQDLDDPSSRGFEIPEINETSTAFFVVKKDTEIFAYRNKCPHTGAPLEWLPDQFLDLDNSFIQCSIHGALFRVNDGECLRGPCAGQALSELPVQLEAKRYLVDVSSLYSEQTVSTDS